MSPSTVLMATSPTRCTLAENQVRFRPYDYFPQSFYAQLKANFLFQKFRIFETNLASDNRTHQIGTSEHHPIFGEGQVDKTDVSSGRLSIVSIL